jgi:hypothetical protein
MTDVFVDFMAENRDIGLKGRRTGGFLILPVPAP